MRKSRVVPGLMVLLLLCSLFVAGQAAAVPLHAPRREPFAPTRIVARCQAELALPSAPEPRKPTALPARATPLATPCLTLRRPASVLIREALPCFALLAVNHPQHAPPPAA